MYAKNPSVKIVSKSRVFVLLSLWLIFTCSYASASWWDAGQLAQFTTQSVRLIDKDKRNVGVVSVAQVQNLLRIIERLKPIARINVTLLITEGDSPNAFASSESGTNVIGINTAMLKFFGEDTDTLAFVMAHEMGHLVKGHGQEKVGRDTALGIIGFVAGLALDYGISRRTGIVSNLGRNVGGLAATLVSYKFDRDQEREADTIGVEWMYAAGFNPSGATRFLQPTGSDFFDFLKDHPSDTERFRSIQSQVATLAPRPTLTANPPPVYEWVNGKPTIVTSRPTLAPSSAPSAKSTDNKTPSNDSSLAEFRENTSAPDDPVILGLRAIREGRVADAFTYASEAATRQDARGQLGVGFLYLSGLGTNKDYAKAAEFFKLAAAQDSAAANYYLGIMHGAGYGFKKDFATAGAYYQKSSDAGFLPGMAQLAELKLAGLGVPKDPNGAVLLAQKATVSNVPTANFVLGLAYLRGAGVAQDYHQAKSRLEQASQAGFYTADTFLGEMYFSGHGVRQDYPEAVRLFKKAALKGDAGAKANLGFMYLRGLGVSRDFDEARTLFEEAIKIGQFVAPYGLGIMYRDGLGVTRDLPRALAYFEYSSGKGYADATRLRDELASKLSAEDLQRSKQISIVLASEAGL